MNNKTYSSGVVFCDIDGTLLSICGLDTWDPYKIPGKISPEAFSSWPGINDEDLKELKKSRDDYYSNMINVLPNVINKLIDWHVKGYRIILTTARPEPLRKITIETLEYFGIIYNDLIMDLPQGARIIINDIDPAYPDNPKAFAYNVVRNKGLEGIDLP